MEYKINKEVANAIIQYLATSPYAEVAGLISELQKMEEAESVAVQKEK